MIVKCSEEEEGFPFLCKEHLISTLNFICVRVFLYGWLNILVGNFYGTTDVITLISN